MVVVGVCREKDVCGGCWCVGSRAREGQELRYDTV